MSLPSSIPLRVQSRGLTLLPFIPASARSDRAAAGRVSRCGGTAPTPARRRGLFSYRGARLLSAPWASARSGGVAELKSQGIPSLCARRGGEERFSQRKAIRWGPRLALKHKYGQRYGTLSAIRFPPESLYPGFSLAVHVSPKKTAPLLSFRASVPARQWKQGSIKQQMLMLAHA